MAKEYTNIYAFKEDYYHANPSGHYFDSDTLKFFGERLSEMRISKGTTHIKDICGRDHEAYTISRYQRKYPGGARRTLAYFDVETLDDITI